MKICFSSGEHDEQTGTKIPKSLMLNFRSVNKIHGLSQSFFPGSAIVSDHDCLFSLYELYIALYSFSSRKLQRYVVDLLVISYFSVGRNL